MFFVCLAHFADSYQFVNGSDASGAYLLSIGMLASPTLILVSGSVTGFLFVTRRGSFDYLRRRLVDRGVFLLLVGHPVLASSGWFTSVGLATTLRRGYITDVIAIAVIVGPSLVAVLRPRRRLLLAAFLFSLAWVAILAWTPHSHGTALFKHYFIGIIDPSSYGINFTAFPAVPWFALYLVGTVIGQQLGSIYLKEGKQQGHLFLARIGLASAGLGVAAKVLARVLRNSDTFPSLHPDTMRLLSSYEKFPPGPTYVLFYAGCGLTIVAAVFEVERRGHLKFLLGQLRQMGEASFFVYALQFYVYTVIVRGLHFPYSSLWPIGFLFTLVLLTMSATFWNSKRGNRLLTVGLTTALNRRASRKQSPESRADGNLLGVPLSAALHT